MMAVNSCFYTRKKFSENYPKFGHAPSRKFARPVFEWTPTCLGPALLVLLVYLSFDKKPVL
jgi:hypothetical protein